MNTDNHTTALANNTYSTDNSATMMNRFHKKGPSRKNHHHLSSPNNNKHHQHQPTRTRTARRNECNAFFSSGPVLMAANCSPPNHMNVAWKPLVKKALGFVPDLVDLETSRLTATSKERQAVSEKWNLIFGLLKRAYAAQEGFRSLDTAQPANGALHAVLGLSSCCETAAGATTTTTPSSPSQSTTPTTSPPSASATAEHLREATARLLVVQHLIHEYPLELYRLEVSTGRLPLHVICAAPCTTTKARQNLLCTVLQAHPDAASVRDGQGIYPLHLACQAGYPFEPTLELLWTTAPFVGELQCPCCPKQLLDQHQEMTSLCSSSASSFVCSWIEEDDDDDGVDEFYSDGGGDDNETEKLPLESSSFETVYSVLQSDPYLMACSDTATTLAL